MDNDPTANDPLLVHDPKLTKKWAEDEKGNFRDPVRDYMMCNLCHAHWPDGEIHACANPIPGDTRAMCPVTIQLNPEIVSMIDGKTLDKITFEGPPPEVALFVMGGRLDDETIKKIEAALKDANARGSTIIPLTGTDMTFQWEPLCGEHGHAGPTLKRDCPGCSGFAAMLNKPHRVVIKETFPGANPRPWKVSLGWEDMHPGVYIEDADGVAVYAPAEFRDDFGDDEDNRVTLTEENARLIVAAVNGYLPPAPIRAPMPPAPRPTSAG